MRRRTRTIGTIGLLVVAAAFLAIAILPNYLLRYVVDRMVEVLPPNATFTYKRAHYSVLAHKVTFDGLFIHWTIIGSASEGGKPDGFAIAIDSLELDSPSIGAAAAFARLINDPASITPETKVEIADAMILKGIRLNVDNTIIATTTEWLGLGRLSFYPWVLLHEGRAAFEKLQAWQKSGGPPPGEAHPFVPIIAAMVLGIRYDTYDERHLRFTMPLPGTAASPPTPLVLFTPALKSSYGRGIQTHGMLDGLTIEGQRFGKLAIRRVDLPDFDIRELLRLVIAGEPVGPAVERMAIGVMKFADVSVTPPGQSPLPLGNWALSDLRFENGRLASGAWSIEPVRLTLQQMSKSLGAPWFRELGLDTITGSGRIAFVRPSSDGRAVVDARLQVEELGTGTMQATLTAQGTVERATLRYSDASLVRRFLEMKLSPNEPDIGALQDRLRALAKDPDAGSSDQPPERTAATRAVAAFLRAPGSLQVELAPQPSLPIRDVPTALAGPDTAGQALGLVVSANPRD